jgi:hypothetical protein
MPVQAASDPSERMLNEHTSRRSPIYHPLLIAAYPVIALLAYNIEEIKVAVALRALALSLLAGVLLYIILKAVFKDREKTALLTSLILILFFSYGHVYNYLKQSSLGSGFSLGRHRILATIWLGTFVLLIFWVRRASNSLQNWNRLLNLVAIVALLLPVAQIGLFSDVCSP